MAELNDLTGRLVKSKEFHSKIQIDLITYEKGLYILTIKKNGRILEVLKIILKK
ncbi:MAG: T9SS C-terminal target domain-containing protein [Porphyromonadaceae bacterium]|nr:MAG: T9SS C-terminal target domain-containing protein [Porphyromonadaceae bacterium]